jgi:hypothetical protein
MILPYPGYDFMTLVMNGIFALCLSSIFSIFSPFGIGFAVFSVLRGVGKNSGLKKVSFAFQIVFSILTFVAGILVALLMVFSRYYYYGGSRIVVLVGIILGVGLVVALEVGVIIWQSFKD